MLKSRHNFFFLSITDTKEQVASLQKHSLDGLMFLFRQLGKAFIELSKFKCREAIYQLNQIGKYSLFRNKRFALNLMP